MKSEEFTRVSEFFRANRPNCQRVIRMVSLLGNEVRFKILCALNEGDFCVGDLAELVEGKHANVSQQLKMLTLAGWLKKERRDRSVYYRLVDMRVRRLLDFLRSEFDG